MFNYIKAIIFDMDGVIVDSMPYHYKAWKESLSSFKIEVSKKEIYLREGENWKKTAKDFLQKKNIKQTPELLKEIFNKREEIFRKFSSQIELFNGISEILKYLEQGYKLGLVTATPSDHVRDLLPKKIFESFHVIVSGDMVKKGKPGPEPYLKCIHKLTLSPKDCIVIENAPLGIKSAKRAGVYKVIAVKTSLSKRYLKEADVIVDSIEEIEKMLPGDC